MRKGLIALIVAVSILSLSGCRNSNNSNSTVPADAEKDANGDKMVRTGTNADVGNDLIMNVKNFKKESDINIQNLESIRRDGDYAVVADVEVKNSGIEDTSLNLDDFTTFGGQMVDIYQLFIDGKDTENIPSSLTLFPKKINAGDTKDLKILLSYNSDDHYIYNLSYGGVDWTEIP